MNDPLCVIAELNDASSTCSVQAMQQKTVLFTNQCQEYLQRAKMILQTVSDAPTNREVWWQVETRDGEAS